MNAVQVCIVGAGPAGLLLAALLERRGVDTLVIERRSRAHVESRLRAGILEQGTQDLVREAGAAARMDREGLVHAGIEIALDGRRTRIDLKSLTGGRSVMAYGQTQLVQDLIAARLAAGRPILFEAEDLVLDDLQSRQPSVSFDQGGRRQTVRSSFVAGCDGSHGICRAAFPSGSVQTFERAYPFAWLGILAHCPPPAEELIYARSARGFALFSMRAPDISRHYLQCRPEENLAEWPAERIWDELQARLGTDTALPRGPIVDVSVTPMRSFVFESLRHGRLFLAGDAAHIVPPTGAKGLNLAAGDVHYLSRAISAFLVEGDESGLNDYSGRALARVWKAQRFSWWMTSMLHEFGGEDPFLGRLHRAELDYVLSSRAAMASLAENYVGLPF